MTSSDSSTVGRPRRDRRAIGEEVATWRKVADANAGVLVEYLSQHDWPRFSLSPLQIEQAAAYMDSYRNAIANYETCWAALEVQYREASMAVSEDDL